MKSQVCENLDELFEVYGRGNLIPITDLGQTIFYVKHGCQPRFVWEKETEKGKVTFWFLKVETQFVWKKWKDNRPDSKKQ